MRWESRGKNWGTNFKFQKAKAIISLIFSLWSGERLDVLGSLENAGVDWLVFRSLLKLKKVVKFSTAVLIVIRGITQMKTNNSPSPSRPTPATSSPFSTIQMCKYQRNRTGCNLGNISDLVVRVRSFDLRPLLTYIKKWNIAKYTKKQTHEDEVGREWSLGCIRIFLAHIGLEMVLWCDVVSGWKIVWTILFVRRIDCCQVNQATDTDNIRWIYFLIPYPQNN